MTSLFFQNIVMYLRECAYSKCWLRKRIKDKNNEWVTITREPTASSPKSFR